MHKMFVALVLLTFLIINLPISLKKLTFFSFSALGPFCLLTGHPLKHSGGISKILTGRVFEVAYSWVLSFTKFPRFSDLCFRLPIVNWCVYVFEKQNSNLLL